jgi:8-oxo-dGTP pyrophosphatase MutT (NUDIX family)
MKSMTGVIVFIIKEGVLLAKKTRVLGVGKWNGYGGGFDNETDSDLVETAIREFWEESGHCLILPSWLEKVGYIHFHNGEKFEFKADIFIAHDVMIPGNKSVPPDSEEMVEPTWFPLDAIPPGEEFMDGDRHWVPRILTGEKIKGHVWYNGDFELTEQGVEIETVDSFD